MSNERKNLPSSSSIERVALCPGSHAMALNAPPEDAPEDWTVSGDVIHEALFLNDFSRLTPEQRDIAHSCRRIERKFIEAHGLDSGKRYSERRVWLRDGVKLLMSGKGDLVIHDEPKRLLAVADFKSGRYPVTPPRDNWQLKSLAIMFREIFDYDTAILSIIQPFAKLEEPFYLVELDDAENELRTILDRSNKPDAPRIPGGKQCHFCPGKRYCPERIAMGKEPMDLKNNQVTGAQLAKELPRYDFIEELIRDRRELAMTIKAASPSALPGYALTVGRDADVVENAAEAFEKLSDSVAIGEFLECCNVSVPKLRVLWARKFNLTLDEAAAALPFALGDQLTKRKAKLKLERTK